MRKTILVLLLSASVASASPYRAVLTAQQVARWNPMVGHRRPLLYPRMLESPFLPATMTAIRSGNLTDFSTAGPWCDTIPHCATNLVGAGTGGVPGPGDNFRPGNTFTVHVNANTDVGNNGAPHFSYIAGVTIGGSGGSGSASGSVTFSGGTTVDNNARASYTSAGGVVASVTMIRKGMYTATSLKPTCAYSGFSGGTISCDPIWIQGGGTATIDCADTGVVDVLQGVTLTIRGYATFTASNSNTTPFFTLQPGANVISDPSGAAAGTFYTLNSVGTSNGLRKFQAICTPALPCSISAPVGYTAEFGGCSTQFCGGYGSLDIEYATLTRIGDGAMYWYWPHFVNNGSVSYKLSHVLLDTSGKLQTTIRAETSFIESNCYHRNTQNNDGNAVMLVFTNAAMTTGTRLIERTYFDKMFGNGGASEGQGGSNFRDFTLSGNVLEDDIDMVGSNPVTTNYNLIMTTRNTNFGNTEWPTNGTHTGDWFYIDSNPPNPHIRSLGNGAGTWIDAGAETTIANGTGVVLLPNSGNPASPSVLTIRGFLLIPTSEGYDCCEIDSPQSTVTNLTHALSYNTFAGGRDVRQFGHLAMNEVAVNPSNTVTSDKNNISWAIPGLGNAFGIIYNNDTTHTMNDDAVALGAADYNFSGTGLVTSGQIGINPLNQGNGYNGRYTLLPGAHDQRGVDFRFINMYASMNMFDYLYKGTTFSAYSAGVDYTGGVSNVSYTGTPYGGQPVLFHALANNGPSTTVTTPTVTGAALLPPTWQSKWEWYFKYSLRADMLTNTQTAGIAVVDGAVPGCIPTAPCGPAELRIRWVRHQFQPTNQSLRKASDTGITPGAVQMPVLPAQPSIR